MGCRFHIVLAKGHPKKRFAQFSSSPKHKAQFAESLGIAVYGILASSLEEKPTKELHLKGDFLSPYKP